MQNDKKHEQIMSSMHRPSFKVHVENKIKSKALGFLLAFYLVTACFIIINVCTQLTHKKLNKHIVVDF